MPFDPESGILIRAAQLTKLLLTVASSFVVGKLNSIYSTARTAAMMDEESQLEYSSAGSDSLSGDSGQESICDNYVSMV